MKIRDIKGYKEFKECCSFESCEKHYPGWVGDEKFIVITDESEEVLLARFPEIMNALSPYVIVGRYYNTLNRSMRYNDEKHNEQKQLSIESGIEYGKNIRAFIKDDFTEEICFMDALNRAFDQIPDIQSSRTSRFLIEGMSFSEIAAQDGISFKTARTSVCGGLKKIFEAWGTF